MTTRRSIEDAIERLIALLDALDGDPDLEEEPDHEPYLAGFTGSDDDVAESLGVVDSGRDERGVEGHGERLPHRLGVVLVVGLNGSDVRVSSFSGLRGRKKKSPRRSLSAGFHHRDCRVFRPPRKPPYSARVRFHRPFVSPSLLPLGAPPIAIIRLVLSGNSRALTVGMAAGVVGALAASQVLRGSLYGLSPLDPIAYGGVVVLLGASAVAASYVPTRRATLVDPVLALRHE